MIKGIIFDLGGTLIQITRDRNSVMQEGAEAMATWYLKKKHIKLDSEALISTFIDELSAGIKQAQQTQSEVLARELLTTTLEKIEAPVTAKAFTEAAIKIYFKAEEAAYQPAPAAVTTLKQLKSQGYRLGLYANAMDDLLVQRLINRNKLRPWLSPTFSSAAWGWRKPKREPFNLILHRWELSPEDAVVVGDTQEDIGGAHNANLRSILITSDNAGPKQSQPAPTTTISDLSKLPALLKTL